MFDEYTRPMKDKLLNPFAKWISRFLSADAMTVIALFVGIGSAVAVFFGSYLTALALWGLNRILDGLDGLMARVTGTQSDGGGYIDIVSDFVIYGLIPAAIALRADSRAYYIATIVLLAVFYVNASTWMYLSALLEKRAAGAAARGESTSVSMPRGIIEGTETVLFYTVFLILPQYYVLTASVMAALTAIGALIRTISGYRSLK